MSPANNLEEAEMYLRNRGITETPQAAIILGSGLGEFSERIQIKQQISYSDIPGFPHTTVAGHNGELLFGTIAQKPVIAFSGRFHHYEGHPFPRTVIPVHLAYQLNAQKLIISNAAGGINELFKVGDLMVINDVMRFGTLAMPRRYKLYTYQHYETANRAHQISTDIGIRVQRGTYMYAKGPNYETKAEIRAFRTMGADAIGMSTAPELWEASRLGLKTVAISLISNMAAGVDSAKLSHEEVKQAGELRKKDFSELVESLVDNL